MDGVDDMDGVDSPAAGRPYLRVVRWVVTALLAGAVVYLLWQNDALAAGLRRLTLGETAVLAVLVVATWLCQAEGLHVALTALGADIRRRETVSLTLSSIALNYLPAKAGTVLRAAALKYQYRVSYRDFVSQSVVRIGAMAIVSLALLLAWTAVAQGERAPRPGAPLAAAMLLGAAALLFGVPRLGSLLPVRGNAARLLAPRVLTATNLLLLVQFALVGVRLWFAMRAIGAPIDALDSLLIAPVMTVSTLLNITPGGIGLRELMTAFVGQQLGSSFDTLLVATLVDRAAMLLMTIALAVPALLREGSQLRAAARQSPSLPRRG